MLGSLAVGSIGFFGPPVDGEVEVGYGLVPDARGRGVATEALQRAARRDRPARRRRPRQRRARPTRASVRVLAKAGFTQLRGANADGQLVMARPLLATLSTVP